MKVLMLFFDGLGIGENDPEKNPFCASKQNILNHFLNTPRKQTIPFDGIVKEVDACLDVEGLPQSATGQTAILTGINASKIQGHHLSGFPNKKLQEIILEHSLLKQLKEKGKRAHFVNVYRPIFFKLGDKIKKVKLSATTYGNLAADLPFLSLNDIKAEKGIYQEFTNQILNARGYDVPIFTPERAGKILAKLTNSYDFTLYEYFLTDKAGHSRDMEQGIKEVHKIEAFLTAILEEIDLEETLVFLCSDHGNLEDLSTKSHTPNPSLFMAWGKEAQPFTEKINNLTDITPTILKQLL